MGGAAGTCHPAWWPCPWEFDDQTCFPRCAQLAPAKLEELAAQLTQRGEQLPKRLYVPEIQMTFLLRAGFRAKIRIRYVAGV